MKKLTMETSGTSPPEHDRDAYSIKEFLSRHSLSRATWYQLIARGEAPRFFRVGSKTLIPVEAARAWREQLVAAQVNSGRAQGGAK